MIHNICIENQTQVTSSGSIININFITELSYYLLSNDIDDIWIKSIICLHCATHYEVLWCVVYIFFSIPVSAHSEPWPLILFRNHIFTDSRTPSTSDQLVARTLLKHRATQIQNKCIHTPNIYALSGIRTHDPSVRTSEGSSCLRPRGYCADIRICKYKYYDSNELLTLLCNDSFVWCYIIIRFDYFMPHLVLLQQT
jgi:hypothetical protein